MENYSRQSVSERRRRAGNSGISTGHTKAPAAYTPAIRDAALLSQAGLGKRNKRWLSISADARRMRELGDSQQKFAC